MRVALEKDGWTITNDPLMLPIGEQSVYVDLGAEKLLTAEKEGQKNAVEIKSFLSRSPVKDLEVALGQYVLYKGVMTYREEKRRLYLAIRDDVYLDIFSEPIGRIFIENHQLSIIVFDPITEEIVKWIN
ncbi:element excision factor XisH family protein [Gloeocapsopsis dulcis]|uniref:element excision factor XisH family protein n=1 Tax=Gloeocapsopsis dulcis TaxID=2859516 RepID=UPI001F27AEDB|nr:element excision factor XisH family protein [Gloeocapsopsis dulcis]WNN88686.1 element excision factor XisH family protein [Gloeocapsopsis dulcis]